jgi:hemolysin activation/secretion protein
MHSSIRKHRSRALARAAALLLLSASLQAAAQVTPGQVGDTLKRPPELRPMPPAGPVVEPERRAAPPAAAGTKTISVQRFEFAGNTVYSSEQLTPLISDYTQRPVTLLEIYEAADKIAAHYARNGYSLASVNVPPQRIEGGVVRMLVSEGRIYQVAAEGNESYTREQLARYLGDIQPGAVYRGSTLEEGIREINTLPGLQARAIVRPGEIYGTSELVVKVQEDRVSGALIVDNYGRENIGEFRVSALAVLNNPLRVEDQLQLLALRSEDGLLAYGYAGYSLPVNFSGTRLNLSYGHADFEVQGAPVTGTNRSGKVWVDHPLRRTRADLLTVNAGASRTLATSEFSGTEGGTSITLLELGGAYNHTYSNLAVTQIVTSIATNFDEASRADLCLGLCSTVQSADQRLRWELDVQHLHPVANSLQLFTHLNGVWSPDPLADTQQYSLGGPNGIRGFPASEVRGDRGYFGSIGLRRPFAIGDVRLFGRVFAESGKVFVVDAAPGTSDEETLTSVGIGADAQYQRVNLKLDWSFPRDGHVASDGQDSNRLFGSFSVNF